MSRKKEKQPRDKIAPDHPFARTIADAYRVFSVPKPLWTGVCKNCCMDADIETDFLNPPIDEMPVTYIRDWYLAACDPGLPKGVWAYLLPRILELLAAENEEAFGLGEIGALSRFSTGAAENWKEEQWAVLDRFQRAYLDREMRREVAFIDNVLCMFGIGGWPLDDLFAQVASYPDEVLARRLWWDWCHMSRFSIPINPFWEGGGNTAAFSFYTSRVLYDRMVALMIGEGTSPDVIENAANVARVIEANADWNQPS